MQVDWIHLVRNGGKSEGAGGYSRESLNMIAREVGLNPYEYSKKPDLFAALKDYADRMGYGFKKNYNSSDILIQPGGQSGTFTNNNKIAMMFDQMANIYRSTNIHRGQALSNAANKVRSYQKEITLDSLSNRKQLELELGVGSTIIDRIHEILTTGTHHDLQGIGVGSPMRLGSPGEMGLTSSSSSSSSYSQPLSPTPPSSLSSTPSSSPYMPEVKPGNVPSVNHPLNQRVPTIPVPKTVFGIQYTPYIPSMTPQQHDIPIAIPTIELIVPSSSTGVISPSVLSPQPTAVIVKPQTFVEAASEIYGFSEDTAKRYEAMGVSSVEQLRYLSQSGQIQLNEMQKLGLEYYEDFKKRIPYDEAEKMGQFVLSVLKTLDYRSKGEIVGSHRRGRPTSGDVDILITGPDLTILHKLFVELKLRGFIIHTLAEGDKTVRGTFWSGYPELTPKGILRKIDIKVVPEASWGTGLLHYTGSDTFNQGIRGHLNKYSLSLSEYAITNTSNNSQFFYDNEPMVFQAIGLKFVPPPDREAFNIQ